MQTGRVVCKQTHRQQARNHAHRHALRRTVTDADKQEGGTLARQAEACRQTGTDRQAVRF